jgi:hypothetical protein
MTKITFDIDSCKDCPFFKKERHYTSDSFELAHDWFCKKIVEGTGHRQIAGYVGWNEEKDVEIPDWCPIKID